MKRHIITIVLSVIIGFGLGFFYRGCLVRGGWDSPWRSTNSAVSFLSNKLDLTSDQESLVRVVVDEARLKMKALKQRIRPEFKAIHDGAHEEISKLLAPEQKKVLEELRKDFEAKRQAKLDREKRDDDE